MYVAINLGFALAGLMIGIISGLAYLVIWPRVLRHGGIAMWRWLSTRFPRRLSSYILWPVAVVGGFAYYLSLLVILITSTKNLPDRDALFVAWWAIENFLATFIWSKTSTWRARFRWLKDVE